MVVADTSFKKECTIKSSVWVGYLSTNLSCGAGIRTNNLHNFKYVEEEGSLNLRIDRRIMTDKLKASMPGFPESCSSLQTFRTDKYSRNCVIFLSNFWELYQENGEWNLSREFDLEGQNSDVSENGMVWEVVWGTCRWVFKILELLTLLGCFALLRRENEVELHQKKSYFSLDNTSQPLSNFKRFSWVLIESKVHNYEAWLFY